METKRKLEELRDILESLLERKNAPAVLVRAHYLCLSALSDFFDCVDDVAAVPAVWFDDERVGDLHTEPPSFPAA
jgi:hypothetical protein